MRSVRRQVRGAGHGLRIAIPRCRGNSKDMLWRHFSTVVIMPPGQQPTWSVPDGVFI
jgi:hypothetical protein